MAFTLDLGSLIVHLKAEAQAFNSVFDSVQGRLDKTGQQMTAMGAKLSVALTAPILYATKKMTGEYAAFENQITRNMSILEGVTEQVRRQYEQLSISISKQLPLSATKVAEGLFHLGQAGLNAAQSIKAMPEVTRFAVAGMMDLDTATQLLIQSQNALGLASKDPEQNLIGLTRVSNNLTSASIKTTASIRDFASALSNYAGQAARLVGKDVEEVTAVLMAFAAQGIKGEDAGYRTSMMLRDLQKASLQCSREWDQLGISVYDSNKEMRNIGDIIVNLEEAMAGWSDMDKRVGFTMMGFMDRSLMATMAIMGLGKQIKQWEAGLREVGNVTDEVSDKMSSSWINRMHIMWNSMTSLRLSIGKFVADELSKLQIAVDAIMRVWESLNKSTQRSIVCFVLVAAAIGPVLIGFGLMLKITSSLMGMMSGLVGALFGWLGVAILVAGIAYTLRAAWIQNFVAIKDRMKEFLDIFKTGFEWLANSAVGKFLGFMVSGFRETFTIIRLGWKDFIADVGGSVIGVKMWLTEMAAGLRDAWGAPTIGSAVATLKDTLIASKNAFAEGFTSAWESVRPKVDVMADYVGEKFEVTEVYLKAFGEATVEHLSQLLDVLKKQFSEDFDSIIGVMQNKFPALVGIMRSTQSVVGGVIAGISSAIPSPTVSGKTTTSPWAGMNLETIERMRGQAKEIVNTLYSGLDKRTNQYFEQQERRLNQNIDQWTQYTSVIAREMDMEEGQVRDLIVDYEKEQRILLEINRLKVSKSMADGFRAAGMQIQREIQTWGERAYEFVTNMTSTLEDGLMKMMQDLRNWGDAAKQMFREIYMEAIRIAFIRPAAQGLAGAFAGIGTSLFGGLFKSPVTTPGVISNPEATWGGNHFASGGIAWTPQMAMVAENGPEVMTPLSQVGGKITVRLVNQSGVPLEMTRQEQYIASDERIVDVVVSRLRTDIKLQGAMGMRR